MEFLSNPVYLGLIIGAFGLLVPVVIYLKQRSKKEISYTVYGNIPLLNIQEGIKENFEVSYRGIPVQDATLLSLRIWNSGNTTIEEADFIDPIKLDFGKDATVIFFRAVTNPDNILSQYTKSLKGEGYITFKPRLLNKGYEIVVVVMVTGFSGYVKAEGLIKDVHSIRNVRFPSTTSHSWKWALIGSLYTYVFSLVIAAFCTLAFFGYKSITQATGYPSYTFLAVGFMVLISISFPSVITALDIYSAMKATKRTSQSDDTFVKQLFSIMQAHLEAQNQTPQQPKKKKIPPDSQ